MSMPKSIGPRPKTDLVATKARASDMDLLNRLGFNGPEEQAAHARAKARKARLQEQARDTANVRNPSRAVGN